MAREVEVLTLTLTENLYFPLTGAAHCQCIFKIGRAHV